MGVDSYIGRALRKYQTPSQMRQGIGGAAGKCGYTLEPEIKGNITTLRVLRPGVKRFLRRLPDTPVVDLSYDSSIERLQDANVDINVYDDDLARELLIKLNEGN